LVSKAWKYAMEKMKYDKINDFRFWDNLIKTHSGKFPPFLNKYLQLFNQFAIFFPDQTDETEVNFFEHWDSLRTLILNNCKNLSSIKVLDMEEGEYEYPENFNDFLLELTQNSQNKLCTLCTSYNFFPSLALNFPKLETFRITTARLQLEGNLRLLAEMTQTIDFANELFSQTFDAYIRTAVASFPELSVIELDEDDIYYRYQEHIEGTPDPIIKTMLEKYSTNLSTSSLTYNMGENFFLVPPKIACLDTPPSDLTILSDLQYLWLNLSTKDLQNPSDKWNNFENFIQACQKLKFVYFSAFTKKDFWDCNFPNVSEESKQIWKQRFLYLKSRSLGLTLYFKEDSDQFCDLDYNNLQKQLGITFDFRSD
jgi:hypothetical protein